MTVPTTPSSHSDEIFSEAAGVPVWPLYLLLCTLPLGIAIHNGAMAITAFFFVYMRIRGRFPNPQVPKLLKQATVVACFFMGWAVVSTLGNLQDVKTPLRFLISHAAWAFFPILFYKLYMPLPKAQWQKLSKVAAVIMVLWACVIVSQYFYGWKLVGASFAIGELRPRGFYSHPLTLAYVFLFTWPLALHWTYKTPRSIWSWMFFLGSLCGNFLTLSRTVQVVALGITALFFIRWVPRKLKISVIVVSLLLGGMIVGTDNFIGSRIKKTFSEEGIGRHSSYQFDRIAFWKAHYLMLKERPVVGHGWGLREAYRVPYYEKMGLFNFAKPYPAHNVFLQLWVNVGFVGLALFLIWMTIYVRIGIALNEPIKTILLLTFLMFGLASMTQNSFQDFEVRWTIAIFCSGIWLFSTLNSESGVSSENSVGSERKPED